MTNLILVVDDDYVTRMQLRLLLEQAGYRVAEAIDGEQAIDLYLRLHPDLVLLDVLMPEMDGFACCTRLQNLAGGGNTPILIITSLDDEASIVRAFAVGAADYITKPIQWEVLRQRVRRLLKTRQVIQQLRQQSQQAQTQAVQLRMALEAANIGTWDWDISTNKVTWSDNKEAMFGLEEGTFEGTYEAFIQCVHPEDRNFMNYSVQQTVEANAEYDIEFRVVMPNGNIRWMASKGKVFYNESGVAVRMSGVDVDITERKRFEQELQRQNLRSQLFADITVKIRQSLNIDEILQTSVTEVKKLLAADRVLILRLRGDGSITPVKEAVVPGFPVVMGQSIIDPCFHEGYIEQYRQGRVSAITDIQTAGIQPCHLELLQRFAVKANLVVPIIFQNQLWGLLITHQCTHPRQWNSWETEILRQLADQIGIALSQAKSLEQEIRQRQELTRSNQELQQFAFVASHDLQEPLRKIKTFGDRLKATCGDVLTPQGQDYLARMQNAASRMQILIEDLLTLSRVTTRGKPFILVNLVEITQEVLSDLETRIQQTGGRVEVGNLPTINADPIQIRQLLQNLIGNALKFHRQEVAPIVKIYSQDCKSQSDPLATMEFCQVIVSDNGIGFDEKYCDRIFNVFQRLHGRSEYEGTGIGLAICSKIVERHHGTIKAKSKPGKGATFTVTLPINFHP